MTILSENTQNQEFEEYEQGLIDTFLQDEFLLKNSQLKDKIKDLLNDEKLKLEAKNLQTLIQILKEPYELDYRLKERIFEKQWDYNIKKICRNLNVEPYRLKDS
jgi:hypothetical protein